MTEPGGSGAGSTVETEDERIDVWLEAWGNCTDEQLKAVSRLRADLEAARGERDTWRAAQEECHELQLLAEGQLAQARARIEAVYALVRSASELGGLLNGYAWRKTGQDAKVAAAIEIQHAALRAIPEEVFNAAVDAAQAAQQPQHASETTAALGGLQSPGPRQDAPEH